ncbi:hypothetical protein EYF80_030482 [Liparis tanakae]|uniref:Uncharacterized protein n=1 Tax=Liparis tanakae TaxID=230148 RepID=A0A4Z2H1W4_9TELE|nr:hypothetical protein EYF80_030482 [Liparis tanakae]
MEEEQTGCGAALPSSSIAAVIPAEPCGSAAPRADGDGQRGNTPMFKMCSTWVVLRFTARQSQAFYLGAGRKQQGHRAPPPPAPPAKSKGSTDNVAPAEQQQAISQIYSKHKRKASVDGNMTRQRRQLNST